MKYFCPACAEEMSKLNGSSDPSGCDRPDYYCCECNTRYRMSSSHLIRVAENRETSELFSRCLDLETALKVICKLDKGES